MLRLSNSLKHPDEIDRHSLNWYSCGPTIYNRSHLGHARTFMTIDLLIRSLQEMGYRITHLMNITDIDDKIMNKLIYSRYQRWLGELSPELRDKYRQMMDRGLMVPEEREPTVAERVAWIQKHCEEIPMGGVDPEEYLEFIQKMEGDFWTDLDRLNIQRPEVIQRVSDNIEPIINYILKIMEHDHAYEKNGSVYFRSSHFTETRAKALAPPQIYEEESKERAHDSTEVGKKGEKSETKDPKYVSQKNRVEEKEHPHDFALWKKAKPFEIAFPSPWGPGRPGWHIECSSMINEIFGTNLDVHAGGIDLKFPHHHNEFLQHLAHSEKHTWATWWLHIGHLLIDHEKMSQSLGNFQTIDGFLEKGGSPEELRMMFLFSPWNKPLDFTAGALENARQHLKMFREFLSHLDHLHRTQEGFAEKYTPTERAFREEQEKVILRFQELIQDHFQTGEALRLVVHHIHQTYQYTKKGEFNPRILMDFGRFLKRWLKVWGFSVEKTTSDGQLESMIDLVVQVREQVRGLAKESKTLDPKEVMKRLFTLSDEIRDRELIPRGIQLQDRAEGEATKWIWRS